MKSRNPLGIPSFDRRPTTRKHSNICQANDQTEYVRTTEHEYMLDDKVIKRIVVERQPEVRRKLFDRIVENPTSTLSYNES